MPKYVTPKPKIYDGQNIEIYFLLKLTKKKKISIPNWWTAY